MDTGVCEWPSTLRGRQDEWLTAMRALDARRDRLTILLIEGALGSGKTRFLQEMTKAAALRGYSFVPQADRTRPVSAKWWRDSSAFSAGVHALLTVDPIDSKVMLAADDLHAAHMNLVRELCCIIRYRESCPVTLAFSRRDSLTPVPEFERYLASTTDAVVRIRLERFNEVDVAGVACDVLGLPAAADLMRLLADAGGNPWLLTELLHGLREEGHLAYMSDSVMLLNAALPKRIERLVAGMVREFAPPTQQVLRLAATLGRRFDVYSLAELQEEAVGNLLPAMDELVTAGVLAPEGQQMAFQCPLVYKALVATMPPAMVVALRRQAAEMSNRDIKDQGDDSPLAALTDSERAIAELAAQGLTNIQIARRVNRSSHTVNFHLRQVFRKLGIRSRVELARIQ